MYDEIQESQILYLLWPWEILHFAQSYTTQLYTSQIYWQVISNHQQFQFNVTRGG